MRKAKDSIRILLIPSSDYLGHPFPQRHNHLFERIHDGEEFEVHVIRFNIFGKPKLNTKCVVHEISFEIKTHSTALYYLANVVNYANEIIRIMRQESIDIVVAGNILPPLTYLLVQQLFEKKIPFIFDLQDYYPTSATGYVVSLENIMSTVMKGFFEALTQYIIQKANVVTTPGIALAIYAKEAGAKRVSIVPNGVSEHFLKKYDGSDIRNKLGYKESDIVVGYIGSIEFWLDMEPLIKAIAKTYSKGLPVKLLLIGKHLQTNYSHKIESWIEEYNVGKITTWLDFIPYKEVPKYIAAMDIGTIPFNVKNPTAYYAAPNKLWEYLSQEVTVATTPIPEVLVFKDLVNIVTSEDDYIDVITKIATNNKRKQATKALKIIANRTWKRSADSFKKLILNILANRL